MKGKIKYLFKLFGIVLLILIALELTLGILFNYNDNKRHDENTQIKIASGAYDNIDLIIVTEIYNELHKLNSEWAQFVHFRLKAFKGKHINIDDKGIRKTLNLSLKDSLNPIKIFCFGGSTMLSTGARDEHTIPSELSKLIHKSFPDLSVKITNFGCLGYNRSIENVQLQQQLLQNNIPDIVLFYDGVNEVIAAHQNNKAGTPTNAINRQNEFQLAHDYSKRIKLFCTSSNINRFIVYLQRRIFKTKSFEVKNPEELAENIAYNYVKNIELIKGIEQNYDFKVFNFLQPNIYSKTQHTEAEKKFVKQSSFYKELYTKSYDFIKKDATIIDDSTFLDISNAFNNTTKTIYTDFCHTGEFGNLLIAERLFNSIKKELEIKKTKIENTQMEPTQSFQ
ncbi:hypothetical protein [Winogradskyella sp.]|uniref:hypothetical protein n=1 Tax=Winogradskyella sp. TaxID=1883156 RepID=UPI0025E66942|nr:hypothetical protein [Winogradskyella sp.]